MLSPDISPAIVDDSGQPLPAGTIGNLAFRSPDPVMMLEYWQNPEATRNKYADGWLITGDLAIATKTAISGSTAAPTTSSPAPAIASDLPRSRTRWLGIPRW